LKRKTSLLKKEFSGRMLHVAPEPIFQKKLRPLLGNRYLTADLQADSVDVKMDVTDIPFGDRTFAAIMCNHVLEHVPDDYKAMREFRRVLADDGWAILMVPICPEKTFEDLSVTSPEDRLRIFGQSDHVRKYGPDFEDRLEEAGFVVDPVVAEQFLSDKEITRFGIRRDHIMYVCGVVGHAGRSRSDRNPRLATLVTERKDRQQ
jgi:SAM-dependent methyltransferase